MNLHLKKIIFLLFVTATGVLVFLVGKILFDDNYSALDKSFIQNREALHTAAAAFNISPRVLVSVIYAERGLNYSYLDEQLDVLLVEAGINASSGFSQIKYRTAIWIEEQITNPKGRYWINEKIASLVGKSKTNEEIIKKLSSPETNIRYAAAYVALMIRRWGKDSIDISNAVDTLGTMYASGICSPKHLAAINIVGRTAKAFYDSDKLEDYFPKVQ